MIDLGDVGKAIKKASNSDAVGHDGKSNKSVQVSLSVIKEPLASLETEIFEKISLPSKLKKLE